MTWVKWKLVSVHFEMVLMSMQDRCTICTDGAIVSEVMLELLGYTGQVEARFSPFGDSVDLDTR